LTFRDNLSGPFFKRHEIQDLLALEEDKSSDLIYFAAGTQNDGQPGVRDWCSPVFTIQNAVFLGI
jgi:hypothetical protein